MNAVGTRDIAGWAAELEWLHDRVSKRFFRREPRRRAFGYVRGLLSGVERENGWQLAEEVGEATPDGMQRLLATARWDAEGVRDDLRAYVFEHHGHADGVLVADETCVIKKGRKSAGVQQQYCGTVGRIEHCQVGVFLAHTTPRGRTLLERRRWVQRTACL